MDCSDPVKILLSVPYYYTLEMAYENNDILNTPTAKSFNTGRLNLFLQNVMNCVSDCVFITKWGIDGPPTTSILKFDGNNILYYTDTSRDSQTDRETNRKINIYNILKLYIDKSSYNNLIVTNYHALTKENFDFIIYRDNVFIDVKRIY